MMNYSVIKLCHVHCSIDNILRTVLDIHHKISYHRVWINVYVIKPVLAIGNYLLLRANCLCHKPGFTSSREDTASGIKRSLWIFPHTHVNEPTREYLHSFWACQIPPRDSSQNPWWLLLITINLLSFLNLLITSWGCQIHHHKGSVIILRPRS